MVRSLFYNGVLNQTKICSWINLLSLYCLGALGFFVLFYEQIYLIMNSSVLMLYYTTFYEMTHRPYILESYIIHILFLSFFHPSIYPHTFIASQLIIGFFFMQKRFQLLQWYDQYNISWLVGFLDPDNAKRWVGY